MFRAENIAHPNPGFCSRCPSFDAGNGLCSTCQRRQNDVLRALQAGKNALAKAKINFNAGVKIEKTRITPPRFTVARPDAARAAELLSTTVDVIFDLRIQPREKL